MMDVVRATYEEQRTAFLEGALCGLCDALPHEYTAELVDGELHHMRPTGEAPGWAALNVISLRADDVIRAYRADRPDAPDVFRRRETADTEPGVPGWRFVVDELFD